MTKEISSDVDHEVLAQQVSLLGGKVSQLENRVSDVLLRLADIEKLNELREQAPLTTAQTLAELSGRGTTPKNSRSTAALGTARE
jgi:hypothetical protein